MSFIYSSNSPEFLNYIASTKTRNDIINDQRLCVLLEDPYIKDNMELALLYRAAQYGNYDDKKEFLGFFLANGPELDTDTLMFFREKIVHSPTYMEIYKNEFSDMSVIDDLRINKYKKDTTDTNELLNCLQNPCEYLGPFSASIGLLGDDKNFNTLSNMFSRLSAPSEKNNDGTTKDKDNSSTIWGNIRQHVISKLIPDIEKSYRTMLGSMSKSYEEFSKKLQSKGLGKDVTTFGDKKAEEMAKDVGAAVKVNVVSNLGDCARIWEQMRRLRVYDPSKNAKKPFNGTMSKKSPDGNPIVTYNAPTDTFLKPQNPIKN